MEPSQTIPNVAELSARDFTAKQWLRYYKNIWTRNAVARTVDVVADEALKAINPEEPVESGIGDGRVIPVKERLEHRKILVQDALDVREAIDKLLALSEEEFEKARWSKEALAVAKDMMPVESNIMENAEEVGGGAQDVAVEAEPATETPASEPAQEEGNQENK